jgi:hypothetical protein
VDNLEYSEPSCASCAYATWDRYFDGETHDIDIGCNYPFFGDLGAYADRESILEHWHQDCIEYAEECRTYLSVGEVEKDGFDFNSSTNNPNTRLPAPLTSDARISAIDPDSISQL